SQAVSDASDSGDAGVIAVKKTGKFVGGVMHF
ncbi:lytic transglycosylase domain-containing protein, partial [Sinorhizobium meliloti]|nr:lytic transglycosylase domain-containing protein [Sinorhizobium meliloti]